MTSETAERPGITIRRCLLPLGVFALVLVLHVLYVRHVARMPAQGWADTGIVDDGFLGLRSYIRAQDYFTGYSYALPLAFAAVALRRYREQRKCAARNVAIGSVTLSGVLAGSGCFLLGCCGSPMLGVYLSLFGPSFLPLVKPMIAGVTTLMVAFSYYWWIWRRRNETRSPAATDCPPTADCACNAPAKVIECPSGQPRA